MAEFLLLINDQDRWKQTDSEGQNLLVESMIKEALNIRAGEVREVTSGFVVNGVGPDILNTLLSGLSIPALLTSAGFLLEKISPLLIEYMRMKSSKEITVEAHGVCITIKGGVNIDNDLRKAVDQFKEIDSRKK